MTDTMVSTRTVPWMKLGELTEQPMNSTEAAKMGGLDFTVSLRPIQRQLKDGSWVESKHRVMVTRDDNDDEFDVVSSTYGVLQYHEAFDFLDQVNPQYVAAGTMKGGRQGFMVVQLPGIEQVQTLDFDDSHELYVVVRTSHDRTRGVECFVMPLRGRCMNQLGLRGFGSGARNRWAVQHIGDVASKLHSAEEMVANTQNYLADFSHTVNRLYAKVIDTTDGRQILERVIKGAKSDEVINKIMDMWATRETVGFAGTGWGLVNAVSEYYEWERPTGNRTAQSQFLGALEGASRKAIDTVATYVLSRH